MTIHWEAIEQYFTVVLFVYQFDPVCNSESFINYEFGTVRSERVKTPRCSKSDHGEILSKTISLKLLLLSV